MKRDDLKARFAPGAAPTPPAALDTSRLEVSDELVSTFADSAGVTEVEAREALYIMARAQGGKFHVSMSHDGAVTFSSAPVRHMEPATRTAMAAWEGWAEWCQRVFPYATEENEVENIVRGIARSYGVHWSEVVNKLEELRPGRTVVGVDVGSADGSHYVVVTKRSDGSMEVNESGKLITPEDMAKLHDRWGGPVEFSKEYVGKFPPDKPVVLPPGFEAAIAEHRCPHCEPLRRLGVAVCQCGKKLTRYSHAITGEPIPLPGSTAALPRRGGAPASDKTLTELGAAPKPRWPKGKW